MANMKTCRECGRPYDLKPGGQPWGGGQGGHLYCSEGCWRKAQAARGASSGGSSGLDAGRIKLILGIIAIIFIIGGIGLAIDGIRNTFSDTKIKIVSASCETEEKFVSILKEALSGVSAAVIEGEEFTTYSQQAHDAVKEREGEYGLFKDAVYFVKLPDSVNVYVWFKTEDQATAYVYKTK